jgi:hypothetical protein
MTNKPMKVNPSNNQYGGFRNAANSSIGAGDVPDAGGRGDEAEEVFVGRDKELYVNNYGGVGNTKK